MDYQTEQAVEHALNLIREAKPKFGEAFLDAKTAQTFCRLKLANMERECFMVIYLNQQHRLIKDVIEFTGTVNAAAVYPREIAKRALELNACCVILSHNHPSGETEPSESDRRVTRDISAALGLFDMSVLDHIIVGDDCYSFAQNGLI